MMWERLDRPDEGRSILREPLAEVTSDRPGEVLGVTRLLATENAQG